VHSSQGTRADDELSNSLMTLTVLQSLLQRQHWAARETVKNYDRPALMPVQDRVLTDRV